MIPQLRNVLISTIRWELAWYSWNYKLISFELRSQQGAGWSIDWSSCLAVPTILWYVFFLKAWGYGDFHLRLMVLFGHFVLTKLLNRNLGGSCLRAIWPNREKNRTPPRDHVSRIKRKRFLSRICRRYWCTPTKEWFPHKVGVNGVLHRGRCVPKLQSRIRCHGVIGRQIIGKCRTLSVTDDTFWDYDCSSTIDCIVIISHSVQHSPISSRSTLPIPKGNIQMVSHSTFCLHALELCCRRYETGTKAFLSSSNAIVQRLRRSLNYNFFRIK